MEFTLALEFTFSSEQKGFCQKVSYIFAKVIPFSKSLLFSNVSNHPTVSIFA